MASPSSLQAISLILECAHSRSFFNFLSKSRLQILQVVGRYDTSQLVPSESSSSYSLTTLPES